MRLDYPKTFQVKSWTLHVEAPEGWVASPAEYVVTGDTNGVDFVLTTKTAASK
jgi:hypothetical protein